MKYAADNADLVKHYRESLKYRDIVERISRATQVDDAIIWALGSKETGWGTSPLMKPQGPTGTGDRAKRPHNVYAGPDGLPADGKGGWGRGLFQIDYAWHEFARTGDWRDAEANISYAIRNVFTGKLAYLKKHSTNMDDDALVRAAIAAYNCGEGVVRKALANGQDPDKFTTHGNYAEDVIARGRWFRDNGGWSR